MTVTLFGIEMDEMFAPSKAVAEIDATEPGSVILSIPDLLANFIGRALPKPFGRVIDLRLLQPRKTELAKSIAALPASTFVSMPE